MIELFLKLCSIPKLIKHNSTRKRPDSTKSYDNKFSQYIHNAPENFHERLAERIEEMNRKVAPPVVIPSIEDDPHTYMNMIHSGEIDSGTSTETLTRTDFKRSGVKNLTSKKRRV